MQKQRAAKEQRQQRGRRRKCAGEVNSRSSVRLVSGDSSAEEYEDARESAEESVVAIEKPTV